MTDFPFVTVDVFTDQAFGGNPLAVFTDGRGLSDAEMLSLTREFNLSETTFILPPENPAHSARIRIFCPAGEMNFAGHPLVGTGFVMAQDRPGESELHFEVPAGLVAVRIDRNAAGRVSQAVISAPQALSIRDSLASEAIAASASLAANDLIRDRHEPLVASVGMPFIVAETSLTALQRAQPDLVAFRQAAAASGMNNDFSLLLYVRHQGKIRVRMFAPLSGIFEDPATGSANAALAALLLSLTKDSKGVYEVIQGVEMGRPSLLHLTANRGADGIRATVGGGCVPMLRGHYTNG
jgi:trans-2,3-dihydro-3-hydroxyanthranilate isomerase